MNGDASIDLQASRAAHQPLQFRKDLRLFPPRADAEDRRHTVYDPQTDLSYFLGEAELLVATQFDGQRSAEQIVEQLRQAHGKSLTVQKLLAYGQKLRQLGLLTGTGPKDGQKVMDPAIGISYGPLKAMLMIPVLRMDPARQLAWLHANFRALCSVWFAALGLALIAGALLLLQRHWGAFLTDARAVYGGDARWLLWHYPVVVVSIYFHEIGHALSCHHYKVRITDFGIAVYLLLATGWARPLQSDWALLSRRQRLITIFMGPFASLLFAAVGVFAWQGAVAAEPSHGFARTLGVVMAVSATLALIPTLLPIFNGDTYLAITELLGIPRLRQRAFRYLKDLRKGQSHEAHLSPRRKALYWLTIIGTVLGWLVVWYLLIRLAIGIYQWLSPWLAGL